MSTLTFAQLQEDIASFPAYSPHLPTNVISISHECGQIFAELDDSTEEDLKRDLELVQESLEEAERAKSEADDARDIAEKENESLLAEMQAIREGEESLATYRERALLAEAQVEEWKKRIVQARSAEQEAQQECKALRARKGVPAGVFKHIYDIQNLVGQVARSGHKQLAEEAAILLKEIYP